MLEDGLILHGGALGDLVLTLQLALRLAGRRGSDVEPAGTLHVVSRVDPGDLSMCQPAIVRRSSEGFGLHWLYGDHDDPPPERLQQLVSGRCILSALGGPHTLAHQRLLELRPAAAYGFDPQPHPNMQRHITEQWQTQLAGQGVLVPRCIHQRPAQRGLGVPEALRVSGRTWLEMLGVEGEAVVVHPGSGGRGKCWPLKCYVEVGRLLRAAHGGEGRLTPCILLGPVEVETWDESELAALRDEFAVLCCPEMDELVALLAAARAFVGNDAGPGHLAALLGTPSVTLFGPTSANVWHPLGRRAQVLSGDPAARPEDWGISPQSVVEAVQAALVESGDQGR